MKKIQVALVLCAAVASGVVVSAVLIGVSFVVNNTNVPRTDVVGPAGAFSYDAISRALSMTVTEGFVARGSSPNAALRPHLPRPRRTRWRSTSRC